MAQIGTIGLKTQNNGTVKVPVFDTGDSGPSVYEMVRVQTASGTGFIPAVDPSNAQFPYIRIQTQNYGVLAFHDLASIGTENVISFDRSGSMDNNNNYTQANNAADQMLNNLPESGYRFALVSWEDTVRLDDELGTTHSSIKNSIDNLSMEGGTEPDLGIEAADEILSGDDVSSISPSVTADQSKEHVQVILTDGDTDSEVQTAATNAKNKGQHIFAITYEGSASDWSQATSDPDSTYLWDGENTTDVGQKVANEIKNL